MTAACECDKCGDAVIAAAAAKHADIHPCRNAGFFHVVNDSKLMSTDSQDSGSGGGIFVAGGR
jgi:hypothetical protein